MISDLTSSLDSDKQAADLMQQGRVLFSKGQIEQAQLSLAKAVILAPDTVNYKLIFVQSVTGRVFHQFNNTIKKAISLCLKEDDIRHIPLFFAWHSTLLHDPETQILSDWKDIENLNFSKALNAPFLHQGLQKLLVKDYNFERVLTHLRCYFLLQATDDERNEALPFLTALSTQCYFNEYIFGVSKDEERAIKTLSEIEPSDMTPTQIILLSCYKALYQTNDTQGFADTLEQSGLPIVQELLNTQILEPLEEKELKKTILTFGAIKDETSKAVQGQYEEHPFPSWTSCGSARTEDKKQMSKGRSILIAGCGTGQQAVTVAMNFPYADITAIDLSTASLAYAKRKAQNYDLKNINFMHGDILDVSQIQQDFDYIACGGVLHHMESPEKGFKALKSVLKKDGVMRIALYSEIARRNIVAVQNLIKEKNIPSTLKGIRRFKKEYFMDAKIEELFGQNIPYFECFSVSETRDLFFHVQEHRFTCLSLDKTLKSLNLDLLIFAPEASAVHQKYGQIFPDDSHAIDLKNWHKIEQDNPDLFIGMYKFYTGHNGQHAPGQLPEWLS